MIKVGNIVQSQYIHNGKQGNIGIVIKVGGSLSDLAQVFYPKTRTSGWVKAEDMKVIA